MVDAAQMRYDNSKVAKKWQIKKSNPLQVNRADDQELVNNLRNVNVYISTKTRLPSQDNFEKHFKGLHNLNFAFHPGNLIELATKKLISVENHKLFFSFKYGELIDDVQVSNEKQEIEFCLQTTYSLKLSYA